MPPIYKPSYQIRRTEEFTEKTQELTKSYKRTPDLIKAVDWALCRKPHHFQNVSSNFYLWTTEELSNEEFPSVQILYRILEEDQIVVLMDIEEI